MTLWNEGIISAAAPYLRSTDPFETRRLVTERLQERDELTLLILRITDQLKKARVQLAKTQAKVMGKLGGDRSPCQADSFGIVIDAHITNRQLIEDIQRIRNQQLEEIAKEASQVTVRPEV